MMNLELNARSPFHDLLQPVGSGGGVVVSDRSGEVLVSVQPRGGHMRTVESRLRHHSKALRVGPETWWILGASAKDLEGLRDIASLADQSGAFGILRLTGPRVRDALAKLVFIDLHPDAFKPGQVASTAAAHLGITLWRLGDGPHGAEFELAAYRSFADSLWHAISAGAAEFGLTRSPSPT